MEYKEYNIWNLQEIINDLVAHHSEINEVYLFGSRAYKTESGRSDIDLLAISDFPIAPTSVNDWLHIKYEPVDLFTSYDGIVGTSVVNGSKVFFRNDGRNENLVQQLDAILLWDKKNGFSSTYKDWEIKTNKNTEFIMSIIPDYSQMDNDTTIRRVLGDLEKNGIKTYYAGSNWNEITHSITEMIEITLKKPMEFQRKAKSFSFDKIVIENEYDFQNLIHLILRPLYPDICVENTMIIIDESKKNADFGLMKNQIAIEAKWIDGESKKAQVIKTIDGLKNFYSQNSNVKSLIFLILYKKGINLDKEKLEYMHTYENSKPEIIVKFIENVFE